MNRLNQYLIRMIVMGTSGCVIGFFSSRYTPLKTSITSEVISSEQQNQTNSKFFTERLANTCHGKLKEIEQFFSNYTETEEKDYVPSVLKYNLSMLFPEEGDYDPQDLDAFEQASELFRRTLEPFQKAFRILGNRTEHSYGGQLLEFLMHKDAQWTEEIYQWIYLTPHDAAVRLGLPDSDTQLIPSWENINIQFCDGDGAPIELYSNAQAIASLASVASYYTDWKDTEAFKTYANQLWESSHHYDVSISEVSYCEGCVDPFVNEEENETSPDLIDTEAGLQEFSPVQTEVEGTQNEVSTQTEETREITKESSAATVNSRTATGPASETVLSKIEEETPSESVSQQEVPEISLNEEGKFCPGHVDLTVRVRITGLSERKNLFFLDQQKVKKSGAKSPNGLQWNGWTEYSKAYAMKLFLQDWSKEYGLRSIQPSLGKPLTSSEINQYLSMLPADLSRERREVILYALNSVGKVPYYYGGKPKTPNYEGNHFSSLIKPDKKGRILSGLDCSGWVNWVYWSAIGNQPSLQGTNGLVRSGREIKREELQPGDVIVRLGIDSHVVMFLGWANDGSMICIHETAGTSNNVVVSNLNLNWPYYRTFFE